MTPKAIYNQKYNPMSTACVGSDLIDHKLRSNTEACLSIVAHISIIVQLKQKQNSGKISYFLVHTILEKLLHDGN